MEQYVTLTMDGARARVPRGTSVLDAAMEYGICIPHLCHIPYLSDMGACRLCIVEHIENGRAKVTTSCTLRVQEGMVIRTNTEKIRKLRRNIAELLVAEAPNSRAVQDIAVRCGVKEVRYPFRNNDCVLCGRCVRVCTEGPGYRRAVWGQGGALSIPEQRLRAVWAMRAGVHGDVGGKGHRLRGAGQGAPCGLPIRRAAGLLQAV